MDIVEVVRVKFRWPGKMYEFVNSKNLALKRDDLVVVQTPDSSVKVGKVSVPPRSRKKEEEDRHLYSVLRIANDQEVRLERVDDDFRIEVKRFFETRLRAREVGGVKLIDLERAAGGMKIVCYYSSENKKFDYQGMAKDLGQKFGVKVDMRSVGIRDAARLAGGIGKCGLSTCCSTWIPDFDSVSIRMAKDQGMSLDPDSINGQCGRLLCCLGYEHENYLALSKDMPKLGKFVVTPQGEGKVVKLDILGGKIAVRGEDGSVENYEAHEVARKYGPKARELDQATIERSQQKAAEKKAKKQYSAAEEFEAKAKSNPEEGPRTQRTSSRGGDQSTSASDKSGGGRGRKRSRRRGPGAKGKDKGPAKKN